jgi:hypothetical protein
MGSSRISCIADARVARSGRPGPRGWASEKRSDGHRQACIASVRNDRVGEIHGPRTRVGSVVGTRRWWQRPVRTTARPSAADRRCAEPTAGISATAAIGGMRLESPHPFALPTGRLHRRRGCGAQHVAGGAGKGQGRALGVGRRHRPRVATVSIAGMNGGKSVPAAVTKRQASGYGWQPPAVVSGPCG